MQRIDEDALSEAIVALAVNTGATVIGELRRCCNMPAIKGSSHPEVLLCTAVCVGKKG